MLKELADKIESLVNEKVQPEIFNYKGIDYVKTSKGFEVLRKQSVQPIKTNSLIGVVQFIEDLIKNNYSLLRTPFLIKVDVNDITVYTSLEEDKDREILLRAEPLIPDLSLGYNLSVEELIILLSTAYVQTENTLKFINSISSLRIIEEVEFSDDGIGQTVTAKQGASINKVYEVQPIVKLKPIRTYGEIEQVESKFLFRVSKTGTVKLLEADGGQWKYEAQRRICMFFYDHLREQIDKDFVTIIG